MAEGYTGRTLREVVRIVASRFVGMFLILVVVVAAVAVATWYSPKWYRSEVELRAKPARDSNPAESQGPGREEVSLFVTTQRAVLMSDYVVASALLKLHGHEMPASVAETDKLRAWDAKIRQYVEDNGEYLRRIKKRIGIVTPGGPDATMTQVFTIQIDWPEERDPQSLEAMAQAQKTSAEMAALRARQMAQCIRDAYILRYSQLESERIKEAADILRKHSLAAADAALKAATADLNKYLTEQLKGDLLQVIQLSGRRGAGAEVGTSTLLTQFRGEISTIDARLAELTALRAALDVELKKTDNADLIVPDVVTASNPSVTAIQAAITAAKLAINAMEPRYTEDYRKLQDARKELAGAYQALHDELVKQRGRVDQETGIQKSRRDALTAIVQKDAAQIEQLSTKAAEYDRLRAAVDNAQTVYDAENQRVLNAATAEQLAANPVLVTAIDEPSWPDPQSPRRPILWLNLILAGLGGIILSLIYAFTADHFDHSIKSIDDAERYLGTPVLASIPKLGRVIRRT